MTWRSPAGKGQEHVRRPRGSGNVQFWTTPLVVITTVAVLEPSYVTVSRRVLVVGDPLPKVTVTCMVRITVPATGYAGVPAAGTGNTSPRVVSAIWRSDVNDPESDTPMVDSSPFAVPFTVRCVLGLASPVMVWLLDSCTVLVLLSRRVTVPATLNCVLMVLVVLSTAARSEERRVGHACRS